MCVCVWGGGGGGGGGGGVKMEAAQRLDISQYHPHYLMFHKPGALGFQTRIREEVVAKNSNTSILQEQLI